MSAANVLLLTNLALEAALKAAEYNQVVQKAISEGRDVTDEEVAAARGKAVAAVDRLEADAGVNSGGN